LRILVDITHPAHVHFFRNALDQWREHGHTVTLVVRRKDIATDLLERLGLEYVELGRAGQGVLGLGTELLVRTARLYRLTRSLKPDVMTAIGGIFIAQAGCLRRIPSVVFTDTENATSTNRIVFRLASVVATPDCFEAAVPKKRHRTYAGYHELAYTHPRRFTPDPRVLETFGLQPDEKFIVVRLVSWGSSHDFSDHGFGNVEAAIRRLQPFGKVLISSEVPLPASLEPLRLRAAPELVHHLLAYAQLFIGESATMASESATLGTPAIFVSTSTRGYTNEQESRYDLTYTYSDSKHGQSQALEKAVEILSNPNAKTEWAAKRKRMLEDMTDVTDYVTSLVESYGSPS